MKQLVATLAATLLVASVFVVLSPDSPSTRLPEARATQLDQMQESIGSFTSNTSPEFDLGIGCAQLRHCRPLLLRIDSPQKVILKISASADDEIIQMNSTTPPDLMAHVAFNASEPHILQVKVATHNGRRLLGRLFGEREDSPVQLQLSLPLSLGTFASISWLMLDAPSGVEYTCPPGYTKGTHQFACMSTPYSKVNAAPTWKAPSVYDVKSRAFLSTFNGTIVTQCFTINGNGYDWASTLSALAASMQVRAEEAAAMEASNGTPVLIYPHCIAGGSSGSAVVGVYLNALRNAEIFKPQTVGNVIQIPEVQLIGGASTHSALFYSPPQLLLVARLLRFVSLGLDFTLDELVYSAYDGAKTHFGPSSNATLHWWNRILAPYAAQVLFAEHAYIARHAVLEQVDAPVHHVLQKTRIEELLRVDLGSYVQQNGPIDAIGVVEQASEVPEDSEAYKHALILLKAQGMWAKHSGQSLAEERAIFDGTSWRSRLTQTRSADTPLTATFDESLGDGISTAPMGVLFDSEEDLKMQNNTPPTYAQQRALIICNEQTARVILASRMYRADIVANAPFARRYVILVVHTYFEAFNMGVREPFTFDVLSGTLQELGIRYMYDPLRDQSNSDDFTFTLQSSDKLKTALAIVGGYPTAEIMALGQSWYFDGLVQSLREAAPSATLVAHHTRVLKTTPPTFATKVIKELLSGPAAAVNYTSIVAANIADWALWGGDFQSRVVEQYATLNVGSTHVNADTVKVQWNHAGPGIWKLPAATGQTSYAMTPRGVAAARKQLNSTLSSKNVFYHEVLNYSQASSAPFLDVFF